MRSNCGSKGGPSPAPLQALTTEASWPRAVPARHRQAAKRQAQTGERIALVGCWLPNKSKRKRRGNRRNRVSRRSQHRRSRAAAAPHAPPMPAARSTLLCLILV